jgi:hypothetical protein
LLQQVCTDPSLQQQLYWIDSLCINQAPNAFDGSQEKNHQVNMMGNIYKNATEVISWLGQPETYMSPPLRFLDSCFATGSPFRHARFAYEISDEHRKTCHAAFRYLGYSTYWSRIWVIQEVVKAKKVSLRYGPNKFPWKSYWAYEAFLTPHTVETREKDMKVANTIVRWDKYRKNKRLRIIETFDQFGYQECSDPRDRIYALLGIMETQPVEADYSKTCEELFEDMMRYLVRNQLLIGPGYVKATKCGAGMSSGRPACTLAVDLKDAFRLDEHAIKRAMKNVARDECIDWTNYHPYAKECLCYDKDLNRVIGSLRNLRLELEQR